MEICVVAEVIGGVLALRATLRLGSPQPAPRHSLTNTLRFMSSKLPQLKVCGVVV